MVTTSRCWLEFRIDACQRVIVVFILVIWVVSVVFLKLSVLRGGGVLEKKSVRDRGYVSMLHHKKQLFTADKTKN